MRGILLGAVSVGAVALFSFGMTGSPALATSRTVDASTGGSGRVALRVAPTDVTVSTLLDPAASRLVVFDAVSHRSADALTLRPGSVQGADDLSTRDVSRLGVSELGAIEWLLQNYQSGTSSPTTQGLDDAQALRAAYQLALWSITRSVDLTTGIGPQYSRIAQRASELAATALDNPLSQPPLTDTGQIFIDRTRDFLSGARYRLRIDNGSGSPAAIAGQLATLRVNSEPVRVMQTNANGVTAGIDLPYSNRFDGQLTATWDYRIANGAVLQSESGNDTPILLAQSIAVRAQTATATAHGRPPPAEWSWRLLNDTLDSVPDQFRSAVMVAAAVILLAWPLLTWLFNDDGVKALARRYVWGLAVVVALGIGIYVKLNRDDASRFDASWQTPAAPPSTSDELDLAWANASSQFFNGRDGGSQLYSAYCALPGKGDASGHPWISARNAGMPQVLHVHLRTPAVITSVRIEPGWTNGYKNDFPRQPKPTDAVIVADSGVAQSIELTGYQDVEAARSAEPIPLPRPVRTSSVYLIFNGLVGNTMDRVSVGSVEVQGQSAGGGEVLPAPGLTILPEQTAATQCA